MKLPNKDQRFRILWGVFATLISVAVFIPGRANGNDDLPYDSGSTGADGDLTVAFKSSPPSYRAEALAVYDSVRGEIVLIGEDEKTWTFDGTDWTEKSPANSPTSVQTGDQMVFDSSRGEVLLYGDSGSNDTWVWDGSTWTRKDSASPPGNRDYAAIAHDPVRQETVIVSGVGRSSTWVWNGSTWTQKSPANQPPSSDGSKMVWDEIRQEIVLFGEDQTWTWDGTDWTQKFPVTVPPKRIRHSMTFDAARGHVVMFGGWWNDLNRDDTWIWNGTDWSQPSPGFCIPLPRRTSALVYHPGIQKSLLLYGRTGNGSDRRFSTLTDGYSITQIDAWDGTMWKFFEGYFYRIDMRSRPTGLWNYTTIDITSNMNVEFKKNTANTPVQWLASGNVTINGSVSLDGGDAWTKQETGFEAEGGPGGFEGGLGGIRFDESGSYAGTPGQGPGGGLPGVTRNQYGDDATFNGTYGSVFLQPLIGGSGGGGSASDNVYNAQNGGGGGGAILISSSRDITVDGSIYAREGSGSVSRGGDGSGGAIRLVADRVLGSGTVDADNGRIRMEGYIRTLASQAQASGESFTAPTPTLMIGGGTPALTITNVAGTGVAQPPTGNLSNPDVVFSETGDVTITVTAQNVPNGTPIKLRITSNEAVINLPENGDPNVTLSGGTAIFTKTIPAGHGTIQAFAEFTITP